MSTTLLKNIKRVSTHCVEDKEIIVELTSDQRVELRLKRMYRRESIDIKELFNQLFDVEAEAEETEQKQEIKSQATNFKSVKLAKFVQALEDKLHIKGDISYDETIKFLNIVREVKSELNLSN